MLVCTATSNGLSTTFIDAINLNYELSILRNRIGVFSGGTALNLGRLIRIESNTKASQSITFTPSVPATTAVGDELELWNQRDEGSSPTVIDDLINDVLADVYEGSPVPVVSDSFTFDATSPIISVDDLEQNSVVTGDTWDGITGLEWRYVTTDADLIYGWSKVDVADMEVDRTNRTITICGRHQYLCDTQSVRVRGATLDSSLDTDDETTLLNAEFLAHQVAALALGYRMEKAYDRKDVDITRAGLQARAEQLRPRTRRILRGRYWRLD